MSDELTDEQQPKQVSAKPGGLEELRALAAACGLGDRAAFERLHTRFSGGISRFFAGRGVVDPGEIDDLQQRVWIGVWNALSGGGYDPEKSSISTFIYAVASKTWLQYLRDRGRRKSDNGVLDEALEQAVGSISEPADAATAAELLESLRGYLRGRGGAGALSEEEYEVVMHAARGLSDRDLAARLAVAPSTVNARKQAGWGKVRRFLAKLGYREEVSERGGGASE